MAVVRRKDETLSMGQALGARRLSLALTLPRLKGNHLSFLAVMLPAVFVFVFVPSQTGDVFLSDDTSMYWATKQLATTGKLYFKDDLLADDSENLLHVRGFITYEGKAVPYNFLGLPILYAGPYRLLGDRAEYTGAFLGVVALVSLWGILGILHPGQQKWTFPLVFLATPLLYYLGRPYMNILPAVSFFLLGLYFLLRHYKSPSVRWMLAASFFFALEVFSRYADIVFVTPLVFIVLWQTYGKILSISVARDLVAFAATVGVVFGVPLLAVNEMTYGSPFTYGYHLFNEAYYPNRGGSADPGIAGLLGSLQVMLMPSGFVPSALLAALWKYLFLLTPVLLILGGIGFLVVLRKRAVGWKFLLAYAGLFLYVLLYEGSGAVWGTQYRDPTLGHTMVRYWIPAYLGLLILASYAIADWQQPIHKLVVVALTISVGFAGLFSGADSLVAVRDGINNGQEFVSASIMPFTEENAVVYAGRSDKFVASSRRVAAWFNSAEESFFDASLVAASMNKVHAKGVPAYIVHDKDANLKQLARELAKYGLALKVVGNGNLSKIVEQAES